MRDASPELSSYSEKYKDRPRLVAILFAGLFLVLIMLIGLYVLGATTKRSSSLLIPTLTPAPSKQEGMSTDTPTTVPTISGKPSPSVSPTPSAKPSTKPSVTPTPVKTGTNERSDLEIAVLNGSGVSGAAKSISSYLDNLGYTIKTVGNASRFDYTDVTIVITKAKSSYLTTLKKDLLGKTAKVTTSISDDIATDAEVIVGSKQ